LAALALVLPAAAGPSGVDAAEKGQVRIVRHVNTAANSLIVHPKARERGWMKRHYWRMRGYAPHFNRALRWAPHSHFYKDLYAIYRDRAADRRLLARHPSWVLRDWLGHPLFIPFDCNGGSCTQFAADIGNPNWRAHWIAQARRRIRRGYDGIFIDDVNLLMRVSDGSGSFVRPMDPRTMAPMTDLDWRRYMAEFTAAVRAAFPRAEIVHNAIWWVDHADPFHRRQVDSADIIELERGFNDAGIVGGASRFGYETLLAHVDWLHSRGASVMYEPYGLDDTSRQFELASYFLGRARRDAIVTDYRVDRGDWWRGWATSLGTPRGPRYAWNGLLRRDFRSGSVLVNPPGAPTRVVALPGKRWRDASGKRVRSLTLGGRAGKVVMRARRRR
jgi:hypothetical protein